MPKFKPNTSAFRMKGYSYPGTSPMKQDKKKEYKEPTNEQLEPYSNMKLDYEDEQFLSDTIHPKTRELFTPGFVNWISGNKPISEDAKLLIGKHDLKQKGRLDIKEK